MHKQNNQKHEHPILQKLKNQFTAGLLATIPLSVSIYVLWIFFTKLDLILGKQVEKFMGFYIYGMGFVILLLVIWLVGIITSGYLGSRMLKFQELILTKIPVLGKIFNTIKQLSQNVLGGDRSAFQAAVLLEVFNRGYYSIGFITSKKEVQVANGKKKFVHVFVPTAINPASGFLILVEENKLIKLSMPVDEAFKTVVAAGMVYPEKYK